MIAERLERANAPGVKFWWREVSAAFSLYSKPSEASDTEGLA